jgi:hypothetical protein
LTNLKWYAVPRLAKTAYAAIAALVVAAASTGAAAVSASSVIAPSVTVGASPAPALRSPAVPFDRASTPRPRVALFIGDWAPLRPHGGAARSFACRAAATRHWQCLVHDATAAQSAWPTSADVLVIVASSKDDVTQVARWLDLVPVSLRAAPMIILGPVMTPGSVRTARELTALQQLATQHTVAFINPVSQRWLTLATRSRYLSSDGGQLTSDGQALVCARLTADLATVAPLRSTTS